MLTGTQARRAPAAQRSRISYCILLGLTLAIALPITARGQYVQFVHAGAYSSLDTVDVYRNGELWLDNFAFASATPFELWPSSVRLTVTPAESRQPWIEASFAFSRRDTTALIITGDPRNRSGHPPIEIFRVDNCLLVHPFASDQSAYKLVQLSPDLAPAAPRLRDYYFEADSFRSIGPPMFYGLSMPGYGAAPPFRHEVDHRLPDSTVVEYGITDWTGLYGLSMLQITAGFLEPPPGTDALPYRALTVASTGEVRVGPKNYARLQFLHNIPFDQAQRINLRVTHVDSLGPNTVRYEGSDMAFRTATPFLDLPSGLTVSGDRRSAPDLLVEVFLSGSEEPVLSEMLHLLYDGTYVAMLSGDPERRPGYPPIQMSLLGEWTLSDARTDTTSIAFFSGVGELDPVSVYRPAEETGALAGFVPSGTGVGIYGVSTRRDTLVMGRAVGGRELMRFDLDLTAQQDSTLLVVASGFQNPPPFAAENSELGIFAVYPSGGAFEPLPQFAPRRMWTYWWFWVIAMSVAAVLGLGVNQARVVRLRARERELNLLVTERTHELQAEKEKTEDQARRLAELDEAKNRFFANISHEFRTPLTLILGPIQDGLDAVQKEDVSFARRHVLVMRRSARRLLRLINQLLDLSKLESGKMKLVPRLGDLAEFSCDLARSFVPLAERKGVTLRIHHPGEVVSSSFDADAMEKVISNLLSNAIKFTPEGGQVDFEVMKGADWVRLVVRDTGPGIAEEDLRRIFERFQQVDTSIRRTYEGSGIGLALAKELAELHGGALTVESEIGVGTSFSVALIRSREPILARPGDRGHDLESAILEEALLARPVADLEAEADDARGATILVVEDNADVRDYLREHLEERYRVVEAEDGQDGLARAQENLPDLVLSDVMMPRMDGYELCRRIKQDAKLRHTPVILLTAKAGEADTIEGLEGGADAYVAKPFSMPALKLRVANLIASRKAMREQFSREVMVRPTDIAIDSHEAAFLEEVLDYINTHLGDSNLSVDWLADEIGVSRRQLERRVYALTELTPAQLVRRLRLERASQLLRAGAGTVAEIAYAVGFRSRSHFSTVFKGAFGNSPTRHEFKDIASGVID